MPWIILLGAALRIAAALPWSMHHPDEIFQYVEQAHRLVFGYGIVPWEYRYEMRNWAVPLMLAGPMKLGAAIAPDGDLYLMLPRLLSAMLGLPMIWAAWAIGARRSQAHALIAALVIALWYEQVYFAAHILTEYYATALFLPGAALMATDSPRRRALVGAGALLGASVLLRFHYAPAVGLFVLASGWGRLRQVLPWLIIGGLCAALASGAIDIAMGQTPFRWIVENIRQNLLVGRATDYGVSGPFAYLEMIGVYWSFAIFPLLLLLAPGMRGHAPLLIAAAANIAVHMAIGHKEYRFILLSTTILVLVAAIGSVDMLERARRARPSTGAALALLAALWAGTSATLAAIQPMREGWTNMSPQLSLARATGRTPGLCGLALFRTASWETGGYAWLHRDIPFYSMLTASEDAPMTPPLSAAAPAFNGIIAPTSESQALPPGYRAATCRGLGVDSRWGISRPVCLYVRPGGCAPQAARGWDIQTALQRRDR
ncbi:MAG: hypothetical protein QHC40_06495 [Sphingobium sp.]|nr:hypothetical protein [Sphingobium sp.]